MCLDVIRSIALLVLRVKDAAIARDVAEPAPAMLVEKRQHPRVPRDVADAELFRNNFPASFPYPGIGHEEIHTIISHLRVGKAWTVGVELITPGGAGAHLGHRPDTSEQWVHNNIGVYKAGIIQAMCRSQHHQRNVREIIARNELSLG